MSFITQCPACETQFKVAPDQLKISEGWVRCGQCQHVFDASLNLQPWWPEPEPQLEPEPQSDFESEIQAPMVADLATEPAEQAMQQAQESKESQEPIFDTDFDPSRFEQAVPKAPETQPPLALNSDEIWATTPDPLVHDSPTNPDTPSAAETQPLPSFMKRAMEKAYWHQTWVRLTLYSLIAILLAGLGLQWFYRNKDELAANHESIRPLLQSACVALGCQVNLPRKLSEVVIDSSSFVRRESNRFDFQLMLRNRADVEVVMPTLELTLTDIENQVIARRMIPPADWPEQPTSLAAQAEWSLQLELLLDVPPTQIVTGYQAELFYP